eukprot:Seg233.3 transcript_id=Seg233.3/GoldUCD/mRNA.D3Y31 product="hypothetical protein" protein_id=Seg233.3/GoldUCD/D3Y31
MEEKTLQVVKELMAVQERAYKNAIEILFSEVEKDIIRHLNNEIQEMKCSLQFSQKDIDELNSKVTSIDAKVNSQHIALEHIDGECEGISNQVDYLESQSRRNNIKILGMAERKEERTWDDTEELIKSTIKDTLGVEENVEIERDHRIGKPRRPNAVGQGRPLGTRAVVAKLSNWKQKERILAAARKKKPDGLMFVQDFSQRILDRRDEQKDDLKKAREDGKIAYFVIDRLIIREPPDKNNKSFVSNDSEISFTES